MKNQTAGFQFQKRLLNVKSPVSNATGFRQSESHRILSGARQYGPTKAARIVSPTRNVLTNKTPLARSI